MRNVALLSLFVLPFAAHAEDPPAPKPYAVSSRLDPTAVASGGSAKLVLNIKANAPYVLKTETPFKAQLTASAGLTVAKSSFTAKDFDDPKAETKSISTAVTAGAAGAHQIDANLDFFLCTPQLCERFKDKVTVPVAVQ